MDNVHGIIWLFGYVFLVLLALSAEAVSEEGMKGEFLLVAIIGLGWPLIVAGVSIWIVGWSYVTLLRRLKGIPATPLLCSMGLHLEVVTDTWDERHSSDGYRIAMKTACRNCPHVDEFRETSERRAQRRIAAPSRRLW